MRSSLLALLSVLALSPAAAQPAAPAAGAVADNPADVPAPGGNPDLLAKPPSGFKPDAETAETVAAPAASDVWIFSGALQSSHETFSGTLVAGKGESQFELKLANGATCAGGSLNGEVGLVRLSEITCSDDRVMRALFVPQGGQELKVFGHVGDERFATSAHLLGTEAAPEKKQTAAPKGPMGLPPPTMKPGAEPAPTRAPMGK